MSTNVDTKALDEAALCDKIATAQAEARELQAELARVREAVVRADLQIGDGNIEAARNTLHAAMDSTLSQPAAAPATGKQRRCAPGVRHTAVCSRQLARVLRAGFPAARHTGNHPLDAAAAGAKTRHNRE